MNDFSVVADAYARFRPHYPPALFGFLASVSPQRRLAWDCGAGNGQAAFPLARSFTRVVATDISRSQLAYATDHAAVHRVASRAEASALRESSVDLVTVAQALHWFDRGEFYREVERVTAPGGILATWSYGRLALDDARSNDIVQRFYSEVVGPYWPAERAAVELGYASLDFPFEEVRAPAFEMTVRWTLAQLLGYVGTWSATARYRTARSADPVPRFASEVGAAWGDPDAERTVAWPFSLRVGRLGRRAPGRAAGTSGDVRCTTR